MNLDWWPAWSGSDIFIVASGPSARRVEHRPVGTHVIAVNSSIDLIPDADMLYACDYRWWRVRDGCPDFTGIKVTAARRAAEMYGLGLVRCDRRDMDAQMTERGVIGYGRNSGFQAINLAMQFLPRRIILVGYDMHLKQGTHWHGEHPAPLNNPPDASEIDRWRRNVDRMEDIAIKFGIEILNATPGSALRRYPHVCLEEALC